MKNTKTYPVGNGEITLTEQDAEELRILLQTDYLNRIVSELIKDNSSDLYFPSPSTLRHFTDEIVRMNDDLVNYDSSYVTETLTENIFNRASVHKLIK